MATFPKIIVLILVSCNICAILCCTHGHCPDEGGVKNQHVRHQETKHRMHRALTHHEGEHTKHGGEGDSHTMTTVPSTATNSPAQAHHAEENHNQHKTTTGQSHDMDAHHGKGHETDAHHGKSHETDAHHGKSHGTDAHHGKGHETDANHGMRGETRHDTRHKRHVHFDLGYGHGFAYAMPLIGFHDYHDHFDYDHHHHHHHHGHHHHG